MSTVPPPMPPNSGAPAKKTSPLVWILGGVAILICCVTLTCAVGGYFAYRAVKNAGFDPDLMQKNPGLALAKMAAAMNPNAEVLSTNDRTGKITIRDKSTGKVMTMKFDPEKKTLVVIDDDGKEASGTVTVESADGTVKYGANTNIKAPAWVPMYPGANAQGTFSAEAKDGAQNTFTFKTSDSPAKVIAFYQDQLKAAGFTVTQMTSDQGGLVTGEMADKSKTITVTVGSSAEGTQGSVMAVEKK